MPESYEGKLQMAKIQQKLDDHISTQASDMSDLKTTMTRIETKLDIKANKDDIEKVNDAIVCKADREEVNSLKDDIKQLRSNQWGLILSVIVLLIGAIINFVLRK